MKCEIWIEETEDTEEITLWIEGNSRNHIGEDAKLFKSFEATDYNDAMTKNHEIMGWEKYKPMND